MVTERDLRRLGIGARNPAARRMLALLLTDVGVDAVEWVAAQAAREVGIDAAGQLATTWLQSGDWRERWAAEQRRRVAADVEAIPRDRLEGMVPLRVLGDRRTVDEVAAEFGIDRDEVRTLVVRYGVRRGLRDDLVAEALGLRTARRELPRRPAAPVAADVAADAPSPTRPADPQRPSRAQLLELYVAAGRRPPAHVVEALTPPTRASK
jgi:hypothetical protein